MECLSASALLTCVAQPLVVNHLLNFLFVKFAKWFGVLEDEWFDYVNRFPNCSLRTRREVLLGNCFGIDLDRNRR